MTRLDKIKAELDADPLVRGYATMSNSEVAADLNLKIRSDVGKVSALVSYLSLEVKSAAALIGRIEIVAESSVGDDPIGESVLLTLNHIAAAKALLVVVREMGKIDFTDSRFVGILDDLSMGAGCKAIANTDKTAILAFSENQQSRARELDIGDVLVGTIKRARNSL